MFEESGRGLNEPSKYERPPAGDSPEITPRLPSALPAWSRKDRNHLLIWAGITFGPVAAILLAWRFVLGQGEPAFSVRSELPIKALAAFCVLLATWIVSRMEQRPLVDYGIPPRQAFGWKFWEGSVWGFAMLSAILLVPWASGHFRIDSVALAGPAIFHWAFGWAITFLAVSWNEEFVFRGYWLFTMARRMRFWRAALLLSIVFGAAHLGNHGENVLGILQVIATGLLFCFMIRRTGTLWFAVGFHAAWDWAETFFYGTPDSGRLGVGRFLNTSVRGPNWLTGGSAGPEGSIFALVILLLCAMLIHFRFPKAIYPDRPL